MDRVEFRTNMNSSLNEIDVDKAKLIEVNWIPFEVEQKLDFSFLPFSGKPVLLCVKDRVFQSSWLRPKDPNFDTKKDIYSGSMYDTAGYWSNPLDEAVKIWEPSHWAQLDSLEQVKRSFLQKDIVYVPDIEKTKQYPEKSHKLDQVKKRNNWTMLIKNPKWMDVLWLLDMDGDFLNDNPAKKIIIELPGFGILDGSRINGSMDPIWQ